MEWDDVVDVLTTAAAFDRRRTADADIQAWQAAFRAKGITSRDDAIRAVAEHYADSTDWLMPAHVIRRVQAIRDARVKAASDRGGFTSDIDPDAPGYREIVQARMKAVADGSPLAAVKAITAGGDQ